MPQVNHILRVLPVGEDKFFFSHNGNEWMAVQIPSILHKRSTLTLLCPYIWLKTEHHHIILKANTIKRKLHFANALSKQMKRRSSEWESGLKLQISLALRMTATVHFSPKQFLLKKSAAQYQDRLCQGLNVAIQILQIFLQLRSAESTLLIFGEM